MSFLAYQGHRMLLRPPVIPTGAERKACPECSYERPKVGTLETTVGDIGRAGWVTLLRV